MKSDNRNTSQIIDDIISYLKNEREIYGEFSTAGRESRPGSHGDSGETAPPSDSDKKPADGAQSSTSSPSATATDIRSRIDACDTLEELRELCSRAEELKTDLEG
ncbi:MAG: hypothetical protein R3224_08905, partial [Balneolaceae bacterium]|nr:hypothetical protein [Balneolaceae bacterium]